MITSEDIAWVVISGIRGVGPRTLWGIADYLQAEQQSATWLLDNPEILKDRLGTKFDLSEISLAIESARNESLPSDDGTLSILHPLHPLFPARLQRSRGDFSLPALFYARGNLDLLLSKSVAVVGSRNASEKALEVARTLVTEMVGQKINIISGYAKGIDTTAHITALRNVGTTTIILSEGIDNFSVKKEISPLMTPENTLVISQFKPDASWSGHFAMTRNKLVCALSSAVLVITSGPERDKQGHMSGTFDAGISALKMGIPTFAVTSRYFDDKPRGNQILVDCGAFELDPSNGAEPIIHVLTPSHAEEVTSKDQNVDQEVQLQLYGKKKDE
jgi:DNA processing protein